MKLQLKRSSVLNNGTAKSPTASQMEYGELAVNYNNNDVQLFIKDSSNNIVNVNAQYAPLASPQFTGTPLLPTGTTATTQTVNDNSTKLATTQFVITELGDYAPLASPTFTGTPVAPTASANTNTTQVATTSYVQTELGDYAPLASPTFTGTPSLPTGTTATTQTVSNNTTAVATTAFVVAEIAGEVGTLLQGYDADTAKLDVDQTWTGAQRGVISALTSAATITVDFNVANNFSVTLAHNTTFANPSNQVAGHSGSIFIKQDGSGGRTAAWGGNWKWVEVSPPILSTGVNMVDRIDYIIYANSEIHAVASLGVA